MLNFLNFIEEDMEAKKTLLSTLPVNTKPNKRKYNERIETIIDNYERYKTSVKKYLDTKSKSLDIKPITRDNLEEITTRVNNLEHARFILNPLNTYFEKMGFDDLLYRISNYRDFDFNFLNDIINGYLDKFSLVNITLTDKDFCYTCYVHEYMKSFLEVRNSKDKKYGKVSETFEKIYWVSPEFIEHINLNFRKLIKDNEKKFISYINKIKKDVLEENNIKNYEECLSKLRQAYDELNLAEREDIYNIIVLAKEETIDINSYLEDSKVRSATYTELMLDSSNLNNHQLMNNFYENLEKLKLNLEEYRNYITFMPFFNDFKSNFEKEQNVHKSFDEKKIKENISKINAQESKLAKLNKKIFSGKIGLFSSQNDKSKIQQLKVETIQIANELSELYKECDREYFKKETLKILDNTLTISGLLNFYYSYDYFKKEELKRVFNIVDYNQLIDYSDKFDLFAMNPTNVIIEGERIFDNHDISLNMINKYKLCNINLTVENLDIDAIEILLDKIQLLLRIKKIEDSSITVEKIWFISQVYKINELIKKEKQATNNG